ncbi:gliding motility-associated C-terminal domain-containing protein [Arcicella sp. DC2W]|uniref:Gliding motility-associated C-terminal domain-containing protein n=1 Tax=Arcicella gelida TaxID=2984195 RepID=A0ABU5S5H0_9BACT|nr:gliding motility-associated C-terminal domain-containing protein [Arcicella sp. DC2W]MEA5403701.1 gliding motility-associated C-terminal domain-containing protein [Arcicella sp. DC2W]
MIQLVMILMSANVYAQCKNKAEPPGTLPGEFSINGAKVQVLGDGDGNSTASNNIPVKICEGETVTLKNTITATSTNGVSYWLMPVAQYNSLSVPPSTPSTASASYNTIGGDASITISTSSSWYTGPGVYVITQGDNSGNGTTNDYHHACQVIEIIKPSTPVATYSVCAGNLIRLKLEADPNNNYEEYDVTFSAVGSLFNPTFNVKPISYPQTVSSGPIPGNFDRIITIVGQSKTGTCPAPIYTSPSISMTGNTIARPLISSITGTATPSEFEMAVFAQNNIQRKVFMRDALSAPNYDYSNPVSNYTSTSTTTFDKVKVIVPNANRQYCFRTEAVDANCPITTNVNLANLSSEEVCTTPANLAMVNNAVQVSWLRALTNVTGGVYNDYRVERLLTDGVTIDKFFPAINNISTLTLTDDDVVCGKDYIYRVITNYGQKSTSQLLKIKATSTKPLAKIANVFADVQAINNLINVKGFFESGTGEPTPTEMLSYQFYRANTPNGSYQLLQSTAPTINAINDVNADINKQSYCYYMTWKDLCDRESEPSEKVCSIFLSSSVSVINWTPESSFSIATDFYRINKIDPITLQVIKPLADNLKNTYAFNTQGLSDSEGQEIYLQIEAKPTTGSISQNTHSNIVRIYRPSLLLSPDAFSPNNDGVNDSFIVYGRFIKKLKMNIYDRWGNPVFYDETDDYPNNTQLGWNGTLQNGEKALQGMYVYKLQVEDYTGQMITKEGTLFLTY